MTCKSSSYGTCGICQAEVEVSDLQVVYVDWGTADDVRTGFGLILVTDTVLACSFCRDDEYSSLQIRITDKGRACAHPQWARVLCLSSYSNLKENEV
jgi:hypothetical protein